MLKNIYNQQITILNRQKRVDSSSGKDEWFKSTVDNAAWYEEAIRDVVNNGVVIGTVYKVLIPFSDRYVPYKEWVALSDKSSYFTISPGDYVVLGEVAEEVTANNIVSVTKSYEGEICCVKHITKPHKRFGATVQLKIEGV